MGSSSGERSRKYNQNSWRGVLKRRLDKRVEEYDTQGRDVRLRVEELLEMLEAQGQKCAISGKPLRVDEGEKGKVRPDAPTILHIDKNAPLTRDNCCIVSTRVSQMIGTLSLQEFKCLCGDILATSENWPTPKKRARKRKSPATIDMTLGCSLEAFYAVKHGRARGKQLTEVRSARGRFQYTSENVELKNLPFDKRGMMKWAAGFEKWFNAIYQVESDCPYCRQQDSN